MNYKDIVARIDKSRKMITEKGRSLTYGEFLDLVAAKEDELCNYNSSDKKVLYLVQENTVIDELVTWIACQSVNLVPAILPPDVKKENIAVENIVVPQEACMAVMTSGTTGTPKVLFRTFESWSEFFPVQDEILHINEDT
ncbi:MAG: hypothetical protein MJ055_06055, partial [Phascolarctobacterium sp.]|nr:hypothetical protein [Phascolarctobacterium sp.]